MIQLAYTSDASDNLASGEIFKIIETSSSNNLRDDLTGMLIFANDRFFQIVEGEPAAIDSLVVRLEADPRHHSIQVLHRQEIGERSFPRWRMERVRIANGSVPEALANVSSGVRALVRQFLDGSAASEKAA
jgi:hypothetical protein